MLCFDWINHFKEDIGWDGIVMLRWILNKSFGGASTGLAWLRIGTDGRFDEVVMKFWVPYSVGNFLASLENVSFSRRAVLHGAGWIVGYWIELASSNFYTEEISAFYETSMFITVFTSFYHWTLHLPRNEKLQGGARNVTPFIVHITHFYYYKSIWHLVQN